MRSLRPRESLAQYLYMYCISVVFTVLRAIHVNRSSRGRAALATCTRGNTRRAGSVIGEVSTDPAGALARTVPVRVTPAGESREGSEPTSVGAPWRTGHGPGQRDWRRLPRLCPALLLVSIASTQ